MTIEINIIDIICRIIAVIGGILCIALYFYDRHKTAKWFKENAKKEKEIENMKCDNYKLDEKYADLIVFDDQPKRQLEDPDCHNE